MAITSALTNTFKEELLGGYHSFNASGDTPAGSSFKLALFTNSATLGSTTTAYATSNEISGTGYTAAGATLTSVDPVADSTTAVCDFSDVSYTSATFTANGCLIYNDSASGDPAVCAVAFGGDKTVSSGTFTIQFPNAAATTAIVRIA